jgi:biopolymer transport protein ExbB
MELVGRASELLIDGGWVSIPLGLGALALWYALGFRFVTVRRIREESAQRVIDRISESSEGASDFFELAVVECLREFKASRRALEERLDSVLRTFKAELDQGHTLVMGIVMVAPLLGLLGTVSGMIETFDSLGDMSLFTQSGGIAGGISQALVSTQLGLVVAVPGLLAGRLLKSKADLRKKQLEQVKEELCRRGDREKVYEV